MSGNSFSTDEASRMLPLLRRIVTDAKACTKLIDRYEPVVAAGEDDGNELREKLETLRNRLAELRHETEELGCFLEDAREGVVRFPGEMAGKAVYLCWKLGEERVAYWYAADQVWTDRTLIDGEITANAD